MSLHASRTSQIEARKNPTRMSVNEFKESDGSTSPEGVRIL